MSVNELSFEEVSSAWMTIRQFRRQKLSGSQQELRAWVLSELYQTQDALWGSEDPNWDLALEGLSLLKAAFVR